MRYILGAGMALSFVISSGCTTVNSAPFPQKEKTFVLTTIVHDAPTNFDYRRMRHKADEVCPEGYNIEGQAFGAQSELPKSDLACVGKGCDLQLQWKIHCVPREKRPFSIFGNY